MSELTPNELDTFWQGDDDIELTPDELIGLDTPPSTGSREMMARAAQAAAIMGKAGDLAVTQTFAQEPDARAMLDAISQKYYDASVVASEAYMREIESSLVSPEETLQHLKDGIAMRQRALEKRTAPVAAEVAVTESLSFDERLAQEKAFQLAARNEIAEMLDKQGLWDAVLDYSGLLVPGGTAKDIMDINREAAKSPTLKAALALDSLEAMVTSFHSLPTERKEAIWPELKSAVEKATSTALISDKNTIKAGQLLLSFLSPTGGEVLKDDLIVDAALGATDVLPFGLIGKAGKASKVAKLAKGREVEITNVLASTADVLKRENSLVKVAADVGNMDTAAKVNLDAMVDEAASQAAGISKMQALDNALPMAADVFRPEKIAGLDIHTAEKLSEFASQAAGMTRTMTEESDLLTIGALSASERKRAISSFLGSMERKGEDLLNEGIHMTNVKVVDSDSKGFTFTYDMVNTKFNKSLTINKAAKGRGFQGNKATPRRVPSIYSVPHSFTGKASWRVNDVTGTLEETTADLALRGGVDFFRSPAAWSKTGANGATDFGDLTKQAIQLEDVAVAAQSRINDLWLDANKDIKGLFNTKQRNLLERIELEGDEFLNPETQMRGKVFTPVELMSRGLTNDKAIEAYYKRRIVADQLHAVQNYVTRRELELGGFGVTKVQGENVLAKMFDTPEQALGSLRTKEGYRIFDQTTREVKEWSEELIQDAYSKGQRLVRTRKDYNTTGAGEMARAGERVEYILIPDSARLKQLPEQVLHYHPGYVPKINEGIEYVLKRRMPYPKAGDSRAAQSTALRAFASKQQLEAFRAQLVDDELVKTIADAERTLDDIEVERIRNAIDKQYEVADGSVLSQVERMENALSSSEGLFTGTRAAGDLLMGLRGTSLERMAPSEAFSRYINHLGTQVTKNEWRIGSEKRWINTVRANAEHLPGANIRGFLNTVLPDTPVGKALAKEREQIQIWNQIPSQQESMFQMHVQRLHDWAVTGVNRMGLEKDSVPLLLSLKHAHPITALKSAAMHSLIGALSPAQLYVQASAAAVALSMHNLPEMPAIVLRAWKWHILDNIKDETALGKVYKMLKGEGIMNDLDIYTHQQWRRTGLLESVRSNADVSVMSGTGLGIGRDFIRKGENVSLMVYRAGELMNRRISFASALKTSMDEGSVVLGKDVADDTLSGILTNTNRTMLELNAANKAWWQGGRGASATQEILGLATQFMQVTAKTVELVLKGEGRGGFTTSQKIRIGATQAALFGAAGVPLFNVVGGALLEASEQQNNKELVNIINQGMAGVFAREILGADVDIASRAALGGSVFQALRDVAISDDPLWVAAFGASATTASRAWEALGKLSPLFLGDTRSMTELSTADMQQALTDIARVSSTGRNLLKAWIMHNHHRILDRRNRVLIEKDFDVATEVMVAAGFRPTAETRLRMTQLDNRAHKELIDETAQTIIDLHHAWVYTHDRDEAYAERLLKTRQYLLESLDNAKDVHAVNEAVRYRIFDNPQTLQEREMKIFWERTATDELVDGIYLDYGIGESMFKEQAITQPLQDLED